MKFVLDTNAWIALLNKKESPIKSKFASTAPSDIALCSVVKSELYFGAYKSTRTTENLTLLHTLFTQFPSLPFDDEAADISGNIRAQLAKLGTPIGPYDLQIVAIVLANNATLVTRNINEFSRVIGLRLENWET
jgi:tRNA(fMet)-specific endonuclease VapC